MLQLCLFSSYEGRFSTNKRVFFTVFGSCELVRPTLARRMVNQLKKRDIEGGFTHNHVVITIFGSTEIKCPTLAEEFIDLKECVNSGVLTMADWDRAVAQLASSDGGEVFSLTLAGSFNDAELPDENTELDSLALQRHLGNISDSAAQILQLGVGQEESHRRAVLRQAIYSHA